MRLNGVKRSLVSLATAGVVTAMGIGLLSGCGSNGYASSDVFFLEVCVYSMMCSNRDQLWRLDVEEDWECEMDWEGFQEMRNALLRRK